MVAHLDCFPDRSPRLPAADNGFVHQASDLLLLIAQLHHHVTGVLPEYRGPAADIRRSQVEPNRESQCPYDVGLLRRSWRTGLTGDAARIGAGTRDGQTTWHRTERQGECKRTNFNRYMRWKS